MALQDHLMPMNHMVPRLRQIRKCILLPLQGASDEKARIQSEAQKTSSKNTEPQSVKL